MKIILCILIILISLFNFITNAFQFPFNTEIEQTPVDSLKPAIIEIKPNRLEFPYPDDKFITTTVKVLNRGGKPLYINNIETSCKCASATIQQNPIYPVEIGKIYLTLNVEGISDSSYIAEYKIYSNAKNSPVNILLKVIMKNSIK
jgi:hypothetical protein